MLETIFNFFAEYSTELLALWGALLTIAVVVVKITPSKKDDKILETILKALTLVNLNPLVETEEDKRELEELKAELEEEALEMDSDRTRDSLITKLK